MSDENEVDDVDVEYDDGDAAAAAAVVVVVVVDADDDDDDDDAAAAADDRFPHVFYFQSNLQPSLTVGRYQTLEGSWKAQV